MSKAIKQSLAAIAAHQAVVLGKEEPAKLPAGSILLTFGKSYALQRENTTIIDALPAKLPAAVKALVQTGGIVTAKVAKASGLDFAALFEKLNANKSVVVIAKGSNKFSVTVRAKRADLISVGTAPAAKAPAKAVATKAPVKAAKASKAPVATTPAKGKAKAAVVAPKAAAKAAKAAPAPKAKAKAAPAPAAKASKGKPAPAAKAKKAEPAAKAKAKGKSKK